MDCACGRKMGLVADLESGAIYECALCGVRKVETAVEQKEEETPVDGLV